MPLTATIINREFRCFTCGTVAQTGLQMSGMNYVLCEGCFRDTYFMCPGCATWRPSRYRHGVRTPVNDRMRWNLQAPVEMRDVPWDGISIRLWDFDLCSYCYNQCIAQCRECMVVIPATEIRRVRMRNNERRQVCPSCCERGAVLCPTCDGWNHRDIMRNGPNGHPICSQCLTSAPVADAGFTMNPFKRKVGVEFEFIAVRSGYARKLSQFGEVKGDGSLRTTPGKGGECMELATQASRGDATFLMLDKIGLIFKEHGCYANKSCGLHVHFDMTGMEPVQLQRIRHWWIVYEPVFFAMVLPRRRKNQYCYSMRHAGFDQVMDGRTARYGALNVQAMARHNTYEVRLHHGTCNPKLVKRWIFLLLTFIEQAKDMDTATMRLPQPGTSAWVDFTRRKPDRTLIVGMFQRFKLKLREKKYIIRRIRRFEKRVIRTEYMDLKKETPPIPRAR